MPQATSISTHCSYQYSSRSNHLTISGDIQFSQMLKIHDVRWKLLNLIVAQSQLPQLC